MRTNRFAVSAAATLVLAAGSAAASPPSTALGTQLECKIARDDSHHRYGYGAYVVNRSARTLPAGTLIDVRIAWSEYRSSQVRYQNITLRVGEGGLAPGASMSVVGAPQANLRVCWVTIR